DIRQRLLNDRLQLCLDGGAVNYPNSITFLHIFKIVQRMEKLEWEKRASFVSCHLPFEEVAS
ncbi:MAG: hypothetical protein K8R12_04595, partial [Desulfobacterales bacterium]|nr:hypothetical protein [Desulfobacterales bacterium]